jgi:aspartate racemase
MKTIGLIGGTGWVSTLEYYKLINKGINVKLGGHNSARCILYSVNYDDVNECNKRDDHEGVYKIVLNAAKILKSANVDFLVLCANTLHQYVDRLNLEVGLPMVHIADATANEIKKKNIATIGLLGTKFTMEMDFYTKRLNEAGIKSLVPEKEERLFIHNAIMNELLKEEFKPETKNKFLNIINYLEQNGAQGIVLGCTEIPLLIKQTDTLLPVFNTLELHVNAIVDFAIK